MIQYRGPFFAAEFACRSGRTDTLGEPTPLAGIGSLASAACMHAVDSSWGPGGHSKVALSAMLAAPFAATFGCVRGRGPCLLFSESLATQEAQKVHQASAKTYQVVAQLTNARVAIRTQPSPDQLGCMAMVQAQPSCAKAALAGMRARASCLVALTAFLFFFA
jgi:hypothetical protein